jgi:chemotaxis protein methyltransferase CheR
MDAAYVQFLQTYLPRLALRWQGFRKVRTHVVKRLKRRLCTLQLPDLAAYAAYLANHAEEWAVLDSLCRISISRFYRDRGVFEALREAVLPTLAQEALARHESCLRCWSAGGAGGEEVYTLKMLWHLCLAPHFPTLPLSIMATDADKHALARARAGRYKWGSIKELPASWIAAGFVHSDTWYVVQDAFREAIDFVKQDIRRELPTGVFHLILCRNVVFTYFTEPVQRDILAQLVARLVPGGVLLVGTHEALPQDGLPLTAYGSQPGIFRRGRHRGDATQPHGCSTARTHSAREAAQLKNSRKRFRV